VIVSAEDADSTGVRRVLEAALEDDPPGTLSGNEALHVSRCVLSLDGVALVESEWTEPA